MAPDKNRTVLVLTDADIRILCETLGILVAQWERYSAEEKQKLSGASEYYQIKADACRRLYDKLQQALEC